MSDNDSKLIFENYKNQLINEGFVALLLPLLPAIAAYIAGKYELTSAFTKKIKEATNGLLDIDSILELPPVQLATLFDPTGVTQWPNVEKAIKEYEQDPSSENKFLLYLSVFATIPVLGRLKILLRGAKSSRELSLYAGTFTKFLVNILDKKTASIFADPKFQRAVMLYINNSPERVRRIIVSFLSLFGVKWAGSAIGAGTLTAASSNETSPEAEASPKSQSPVSSTTEAGNSEQNPIPYKFSDIPNSSTKNKQDYIGKTFQNDKDGKYYIIVQ